MELLFKIICLVAAIGLMVVGFVYMFSPKHAGEIFRRLLVSVIVLVVGLILLCQLLNAALAGNPAVITGCVATSIAAYLVRNIRQGAVGANQTVHSGERLPSALPQLTEEEDQ